MERTPIDTSLTDLAAIQRRIDKLIQTEKTLIADLSRRSDTCWTFPDPVSISDYYLICIQLGIHFKDDGRHLPVYTKWTRIKKCYFCSMENEQ